MHCPLEVMRLADRYTAGDCQHMSRCLKQHPDFEVWYRRSVLQHMSDRHPSVIKSQLCDLMQRLGSFERALSLYDLTVPSLEQLHMNAQSSISDLLP